MSATGNRASQWASGREVTLPSGKVALLRDPDPMLLLRAKLPKDLVQAAMQQTAAGNDPKAKAADDKRIAQAQQDFITNPSRWGELGSSLDELAILYFLSPRLTRNPQEEDIEHDLLYVGRIGDGDKMYLFTDYTQGEGAAQAGIAFRQPTPAGKG